MSRDFLIGCPGTYLFFELVALGHAASFIAEFGPGLTALAQVFCLALGCVIGVSRMRDSGATQVRRGGQASCWTNGTCSTSWSVVLFPVLFVKAGSIGVGLADSVELGDLAL